VRPDGAVHDLRATMAVVEKGDDGTPVILGSVQDLTEQRRFEREIAARLAVSEALDGWEDFECGAERLLRDLGEALSCDVGALWLPCEEGLAVRTFWQDDSLDLEEFENKTEELRFPRGDGLIGRVWETLEPAILPDLSAVDQYPRRVATEPAGLRGAVVLPACDGDDLMAVIEFYSRDEVVATDSLRRLLAGVGNEVGRFLVRHRGELAAIALTPREREILQLAAHGHSGRRIAELLVVSPATVKTHFEHAYQKLEVSDRASAVAKALRLGLIE
jgi:DNA-binding NarL/FixJ family response regulator